jgi:hypothetical protein
LKQLFTDKLPAAEPASKQEPNNLKVRLGWLLNGLSLLGLNIAIKNPVQI